ncbi:Uu.00g146930.m01.CDS01 [Anthostomella pinea]|uniref:Thymocyte nuclear protein 1 n=1 Tax=Anthostomella pinea TaxID=933095 RepID=A0AAI8VRD0_9PEZI|nr:Uu.00g146930.m01.CDS01 [Anthostomella pinea]
MPKRKAAQLEAEPDTKGLRRSTRRKSSALDNAQADSSAKETKTRQPKPQKPKAKKEDVQPTPKLQARTTKPAKAQVSAAKPETNDTTGSSERWYWLMKAEPETRLENGTDVKFSIDDLASRTEPEPWDGIRAYAARNNLRSMKKGELAFFYHSNCKEPGIVGTMEIVEEHSPDLSAHDPKAPYYDASSKPSDPKWSVVHVKFRSKFTQSIGLKELREMGKPGQPLETMQMLKQSRLSVSRVSPAEWEHLMDVVKQRGGETQ